MPSYKEYVAQLKEKYGVKFKDDYDKSIYEYHTLIKQQMAADPNFNPKAEFEKFAIERDKNDALKQAIKNEMAAIKKQKTDALVNNDNFKQLKANILKWSSDRNNAKKSMEDALNPLKDKIKAQLRKSGLNTTYTAEDVLVNFGELYKDYSNYMTGENTIFTNIMQLPTAIKLTTEITNAGKSQFYLKAIDDCFDDYKNYVALKQDYEEKKNFYEVEHEADRKEYHDIADKVKTISNLEYSKYEGTVTCDALEGVDGADGKTMELQAARKYSEQLSEIVRREHHDKYSAIEHYLKIEKASDAHNIENKNELFDELAEAKAEAKQYNGFMQFLGRYILPGSVFKLGAVMNKIDAITDILKDGKFTDKEISDNLQDAEFRLAENERIAEEERLAEEKFLANEQKETTVEDLDRTMNINKKPLSPEEQQQLGMNTSLEINNSGKTKVILSNKNLHKNVEDDDEFEVEEENSPKERTFNSEM